MPCFGLELSLKLKLRQSITKKEREKSSITGKFFHCPRTSARVTESAGNHPTYDKRAVSNFPALSTQLTDGHDEYYYESLIMETHNLHEEIPRLGVLSKAVRQTVSNRAPGLYPSALQIENVISIS